MAAERTVDAYVAALSDCQREIAEAARSPAGRRRGSGPRHTLGPHGLAVQARLNARPMAPESTLPPAGRTLKVFEVAAGSL